jgi:putative SOS response-associated peptidase YedK
MCYSVATNVKLEHEYARILGSSPDEIAHFQSQVADLQDRTPYYWVSAFSHPKIMVVTNDKPDQVQLYEWGLIPFWSKDIRFASKIANQTLNARSETIFSKPSFREAAKKRRCLVLVDGFFEYHEHEGLKYPFFIKSRNDQPLILAGLWEYWKNEEADIQKHTFSIITTRANNLLAKIHNKNPDDPRMPVILPQENRLDWLADFSDNLDKKSLEELLVPYDEDHLDAYPVAQLSGKNGVGNSKMAHERHLYDDLVMD